MSEKHLTPEELVDVIEGTLAAARAAHADGCAECRRKMDELRSVMVKARAIEVPEPSPLFWDHFSARVREAVAAEPARTRQPWWAGWSVSRLTVALTVVTALLAIMVGTVMFRSADQAAPVERAVASVEPRAESAAAVDAPEVTDESAEWALVLEVAESLDLQDVDEVGLAVRQGAVERAVLELSADERRELGRLLQSALKSGSTES